MRIALPTACGWLLILLSILALAASFVNVSLATALAAAALISLTLSSWLMAQFSLSGWAVVRKRSGDGECFESISLPVIVTNRLPFRRNSCLLSERCRFAPGGWLHWPVPSLKAGESLVLERRVRAVRRGIFPLNRIRLRTGDPLGLFRKSFTFRCPDEVTIHPAVQSIASIPFREHGASMANWEGRPLGNAGSGSEFFGVRPFRTGDEIRYIHWRATARQNTLMVRELEAAALDRIVLLLDTRSADAGCDRYESNFEALASLALSIADCLGRGYCHLTFLTCFNGSLLRIQGDAAGIKGQLTDILSTLTLSRMKPEDLLDSALEDLDPGTHLFFLGMSCGQELMEKMDWIADQRVNVRFLLALRENFPKIRPRSRRVARTDLPKSAAGHAIVPRLLTFGTRFSDVLKGE